MRRATLAGVATIEHGNDGDEEVFRLMANRSVALCPTLAATEAIQRYRGWQPGTTPMPSSLAGQKTSFQVALASGVKICAGSDVGVFTHGTQGRELELMVEYGMPAVEVLRSATSINAEMLDMGNKLGAVKPGHFADLIAVPGNPLEEIKNLRLVKWVMKNGVVVEK
jgi:imidazolonepropionase-like amidohydrolase